MVKTLYVFTKQSFTTEDSYWLCKTQKAAQQLLFENYAPFVPSGPPHFDEISWIDAMEAYLSPPNHKEVRLSIRKIDINCDTSDLTNVYLVMGLTSNGMIVNVSGHDKKEDAKESFYCMVKNAGKFFENKWIINASKERIFEEFYDRDGFFPVSYCNKKRCFLVNTFWVKWAPSNISSMIAVPLYKMRLSFSSKSFRKNPRESQEIQIFVAEAIHKFLTRKE